MSANVLRKECWRQLYDVSDDAIFDTAILAITSVKQTAPNPAVAQLLIKNEERKERFDLLISNDKQGKINVDRNVIIDDACHHVNIDVRNAHANSTCSEFFSLLWRFSRL